MTVETLVRFLLGDAAAIRAVATNPWSLWVGLALVASAALARSSVHRDVRREPWHLLVPLVASLVAALLVFRFVSDSRATLAGFRAFLGAFWCTAPLAWLYALPIERWSATRAQAVKRRLSLLAVVATWRVALTVRVLSVMLEASWWQLVAPVLLVGDGLALAALWLTTPPPKVEAPQGARILDGMGVLGPRAPEADRVLTETSGCLNAVGVVTLPVWIVLCLRTSLDARAAFPAVGEGALGLDLALLTATSVVAGAVLVARGVGRHAVARRVAEHLAGGAYDAALEALARAGPRGLPSSWEPPPAARFGGDGPRVLLELVERAPAAHWARPRWVAQLRELVDEPLWWYGDEDLLERLVAVLQRLPEGPKLAAAAAEGLEGFRADRAREDERDARAGRESRWQDDAPRRAAALAALKALAGPAPPSPAGA